MSTHRDPCREEGVAVVVESLKRGSLIVNKTIIIRQPRASRRVSLGHRRLSPLPTRRAKRGRGNTHLDDLPLGADGRPSLGEASLQARRVRRIVSIGTGLEQDHLHERRILGESGAEGRGERQRQDHRERRLGSAV